ncbi:transmembrane protease serine 9-like [Chelonus insularis]|uniref:transmembrane protease serine 9-like n=1 Tax=Chelonus insularis TaxID=460826 RepID=UPI00158A8D85|nr:transmembrane protease serine 9-like [Chelonus insularis]
MKSLATLVAVLSVVSAVSARDISRVVGGTEAAEGAHPHQVSLRRGNSHFCGGVILNSYWIVTAAHCLVYTSPSSVSVVVGTNSLSKGGEYYKAQVLMVHEKYDSSKFLNDIGLIKVSEEIVFTEKIQPISLPKVDDTFKEYPVKLSGWGSIYVGSSLPDKLQEIDLMVITHEKCLNYHPAYITKSHVCTLTKVGEGACHGDSGGPLSADGVLVGLVSFGRPCARGFPDVYTRVSAFVDWIEDTMAKTDMIISQLQHFNRSSIMFLLNSLFLFLIAINGNEAANIARVVGGRDAPEHKYPYQVSLSRMIFGEYDHFCGGSIIHKNWILTAGHCVEGGLDNFIIKAGINRLNQQGDIYNIWFSVIPDSYVNFFHDDIALIRVREDIVFSDYVKPIALARDDLQTDFTWAIFSGWGSTYLGGPSPNNLQEIDMMIISNDICRKEKTTITANHICTLSKPLQGNCHGDSGGPLVLNGFQVGIASYVTPCAVGNPDAYTRVSKYVGWIHYIMEKYQSPVFRSSHFNKLLDD